MSYARVCVKVGVDANLPSKVHIRTENSSLLPDRPYYEVNIDYQWKPVRCEICKVIGHRASHCNSVKIPRPIGRIQAKALPNSPLGRDKIKGPNPSLVKNISGPHKLPSTVDINIEQQLIPPSEKSACFSQPDPRAAPGESSVGPVALVYMDALVAVDIS
ncbi:hypothetical protein Nepgr_023899 [Nepenthes gracilis]|uniref:DUF4283 domain-containing protein n=1 Tax=Nepenthes gracilis TaxID=150966 RepID=A0AAD3T554_NEPGR|nr:hypothetical protein Nepgr_023899 [Nepenthes gracilis]